MQSSGCCTNDAVAPAPKNLMSLPESKQGNSCRAEMSSPSGAPLTDHTLSLLQTQVVSWFLCRISRAKPAEGIFFGQSV